MLPGKPMDRHDKLARIALTALASWLICVSVFSAEETRKYGFGSAAPPYLSSPKTLVEFFDSTHQFAGVGGLDPIDIRFASERIASEVIDGEVAVAPGHGKSCSCCGPQWIVRGGALFMQRGQPDSSVLIFDTGDPANALNANAFDFQFETGWEASMIRDCGDRGWEVRFLMVDGWDAASNLTAAPASLFQINNVLPTFLPGTTLVAARYHSDLLGGEVNRRRRVSDRMTVLAGFRYLELDEHFHVDADTAVLPTTYDTVTGNQMYGGQLGVEATLFCRDRLTVDTIAKLGVYYNDAEQATAFDTGAVVATAAGTSDGAAFAGEWGIASSFCLTDSLSLRASYNLMYLDSVVLASDQIPVTNLVFGTGINAQGGAFYHGAMVGLEYRR